LLVLCLVFVIMFPLSAEEPQEISFQEFIESAIKNDTGFENILIDELSLKYRKDLGLPARDIVLSVKAEYDFILSQNREEPSLTTSLSKLFPIQGTEIEASYRTIPALSSDQSNSELVLSLSQPIAENAFGKVTRYKDKIIGTEIDLAKHQIIEAYEDYYAKLMTVYLNWIEAYDNLEIGQYSYNENEKLLNDIKQRERSAIALKIDVNKTNLQVLAKEEKLVQLEENYQKQLNIIKTAIRYKGSQELKPKREMIHKDISVSFDPDYENFKRESRTYEILDLLKDKSQLEVDKLSHELLPSVNLLFRYNLAGKDPGIKNQEDQFFAGVEMDWPIKDQVKEAQYEVSIIQKDKTRLLTQNIHYKLYQDLKNLELGIKRERKLITIANKKIKLSQSVLKDEIENYSFGKVTLNDYIDAVNSLDNQRFNKISHETLHQKLITEWLRLTDRLVSINLDSKSP